MGTSSRREVDRLTAIVNTVLGEDSRDGFKPIMQFLVELFHADGAIVWEAGPEVNFAEQNPRGRVFVLAAQTPPEINIVFGDIPLEESKVGRAIIEGKVKNSTDVRVDVEAYRAYAPLKQAGVCRLLAAPVNVPGGGKGVVSLYGTVDRPSFTKNEARQLAHYAKLIPGLLKAVRDKVNYALIGKVNSVIQAAGAHAPHGQSIHGEPKIVFQEVCDLLADAFQCMEATVVMQDVHGNPDLYKIAASTWRGKFRKRSYRKDTSDGITGWVLAQRLPVRMLDLSNFRRDKVSIQKTYPGMVWHKPASLIEKMREEIEKSGQAASLPAKLPPMSFVAVPIIVDDKAVGVVRCAAIRPATGYVGPFFFCSYDQEILAVVAGQLAQYWSSWLKRRSIAEENRARDQLVEHITALNNIVETRLSRDNFDQRELFNEILHMVATTIDGADALDIRLCNEGTDILHFAYTWGEPWMEGNPPDQPAQALIAKTFSVRAEDARRSAGAYVYTKNRICHIEDVRNRRRWPYYDAVFPQAKRMLVAPIVASNSVIGVLDIYGMGERPFAPIAETAARLVGRQIGLYHHLATAISDRRKAWLDLETSLSEQARLVRTQSKTFEDVAHQLRGPLVQARIRANSALMGRGKLFEGLDTVGTLVRKTLRVTTTMRVLGKLYRDEPIPLQKKTLLRERDLLRMLQESAKDNEVIVPPDRRVKFSVDAPSFAAAKIDMRRIEIDLALIEQAVNSLLDNAGKYSYPNTNVQIFGGQTKKTKRFYITVRNTGFPISPGEAKLCVKREWRGARAASVAGEGSGIGLWIVDHIMKAHGGELIAVPTNRQNQTDVRLIF